MLSCPGCARNAGLGLSSILTRPWRSNKIFQRLPILAQQRTYFEEKYNPEESARILKILNEAKTEEDLKRFIISSKRICELIKMRNNSGGFKDLDDLIPVIGVKILDKFYNSMLEKKSLGLGNPMMPTVTSQNISTFSRILSITVTGNKLSWALIHREEGTPLKIQSLELRQFSMTPKTHFLHLLNQITDLAVSLPPCDLCIIEEFASQVPSTYMFSYYLQLTQVRSMLLGYLTAQPNGPQMLSIKTVAVARLFNTYVGSEKVSGQLVVEDLFKNSTNLEMAPDLKYFYFDSDPETKECLSNVFLLNLAYWKLTSQFS